jgi:ADP-ribosylglycohydrolase
VCALARQTHTRENTRAVTAEFVKLLRNPYDLSGAALPNAFSLKRAGLSSEVRETVRAWLGGALRVCVCACVRRPHACCATRDTHFKSTTHNAQRTHALRTGPGGC